MRDFLAQFLAVIPSFSNPPLFRAKRRAVPPGAATLTGACVERKGERPEMEDAHVCIDDFQAVASSSVRTAAFYAVYDGHGGARAAQHAAKRLHVLLAERLNQGRVMHATVVTV